VAGATMEYDGTMAEVVARGTGIKGATSGTTSTAGAGAGVGAGFGLVLFLAAGFFLPPPAAAPPAAQQQQRPITRSHCQIGKL
jgi:hypothetical protein